jgi:molybdenum cofactor cytidylyltransferase
MIAAIILAAGMSKRMGQPKLLLPWEGTTVLGKVIKTFKQAGIEYILVVTGGDRELVETNLTELATQFPTRSVFNPEFAQAEMLSSLQRGLAALPSEAEAALIGLGDQPQVQARTVRRVCAAFVKSGAPLVVPSYQLRRGHPWLVARSLWGELIKVPPSQSPRSFLQRHDSDIYYVNIDTPSILEDLDTPEDYAQSGKNS